jgi:hypothetical protein
MATIDHVLPRYKGGTRDESNLVSACRLCNNRRCYEDALGLLDGSLLGSYPPSDEQRRLHKIARRERDRHEDENQTRLLSVRMQQQDEDCGSY